MAFLALLTKEMRLRLRRERTIWVIIAYIVLLGLLGWLAIMNSDSNNTNYYTQLGTMSETGINMYILLSSVQLFLLLFITPSFTATAINSEKEHQTYDMLLCSQLSPFSLVTSKLLAGLANSLILIAAAIPLFSLVFFFGGIAVAQILSALAIFISTVILVGTGGLLCSIVFKHPQISTAVAYMGSLLWFVFPIIVSIVMLTAGNGNFFLIHPNVTKILYSWNPLTALTTTYPNGVYAPYPLFPGLIGRSSIGVSSIPFGGLSIALWVIYILFSLLASLIFFGLSLLLLQPLTRFHPLKRKRVLAEQ
jgi:ABC-type transport system involved in multi-copper enzyme maturation permease subunit